MNQFRIQCSEVNYFTILVEAENEIQAETLAHANINSFDVELFNCIVLIRVCFCGHAKISNSL